MPGMCGRYASLLPPEAVARFFRTTNALANIGPSWNVAPSQQAMVVRRHPETGERHLDLLQWGLLPYWTKERAQARRPINARAETIATSPMFRQAFAKRRARVPAGVFYEWRKTRVAKQYVAIARNDGDALAFAGLWEGYRWPSGATTRRFCIITTRPNALMVPIHDRMPVALEPGDGRYARRGGWRSGSTAAPGGGRRAQGLAHQHARERAAQQHPRVARRVGAVVC